MDPYLGEIKLWAINFAPKGWALCDGSLLNVAQNQALFSLLGTHYGGNGSTTFALPDLRGRVPVNNGSMQFGTQGGEETVTLAANQVPQHTHQVGVYANPGNKSGANAHHIASAVTRDTPPENANLYAPAAGATKVALNTATVGPAGLSAGHNNMQPYLALNYYIATTGIYPPRN